MFKLLPHMEDNVAHAKTSPYVVPTVPVWVKIKHLPRGDLHKFISTSLFPTNCCQQILCNNSPLCDIVAVVLMRLVAKANESC